MFCFPSVLPMMCIMCIITYMCIVRSFYIAHVRILVLKCWNHTCGRRLIFCILLFNMLDSPIPHWFRKWLVAWTAPSQYLNQCWNIVNWNLRNKPQWNFNRNSNISIQENAFENVVCEMASICLGLNVLTILFGVYYIILSMKKESKVIAKMAAFQEAVFPLEITWAQRLRWNVAKTNSDRWRLSRNSLRAWTYVSPIEFNHMTGHKISTQRRRWAIKWVL